MPAPVYSGYWIGFDLGGTKMLSTVFDQSFEPVGQKKDKTNGHEGTGAGLERIVATIRSSLKEANIPPEKLSGIGMGCPGPLDLERGVIFDAPNLGWKDVPMKETLERAFGCPAVISNDVDAGVYGEYCFGAAKDSRCTVGVFPGTGIGGGCVYEGNLIQGSKSSCMEIGHLQVVPDGPFCGCGGRGCLEAVASRLAISAAAATAAQRGEAPHLLEISGTDLAKIRSHALADSIAAGDVAIERIVRLAARWIGAAMAGVINLLGPDVLLLGGGMVQAMPSLFLEEVESAARSRVMPFFKDGFRVLAAQLGDDATAKGAAAWARKVISEVG